VPDGRVDRVELLEDFLQRPLVGKPRRAIELDGPVQRRRQRGLPEFGLSEKEQQALWERFATSRVQGAPPGDKPVLTLESIDIAWYGLNRLLRVRFRSDELRGSMHWTVLGLYTDVDTILLAHLGTPENREEGIAGFEAIAASLRLN